MQHQRMPGTSRTHGSETGGAGAGPARACPEVAVIYLSRPAVVLCVEEAIVLALALRHERTPGTASLGLTVEVFSITESGRLGSRLAWRISFRHLVLFASWG
jgi:hypothetical protein